MTILHMQPASWKRIKFTLVQSKKSVPETIRGKGMHTSSSNVAAMGTQPSHVATVSKYNYYNMSFICSLTYPSTH
jgi:hypothetical protein